MVIEEENCLKKLFLITLLLVCLSCTTTPVISGSENYLELEGTIVELQEVAKKNQYEELKKYFLPTFKNSIVLKKIRQYDLSKFNVIFSEPELKGSTKAKSIMILNYGSDSIYFDITWKFKKNGWKVLDVSQRS